MPRQDPLNLTPAEKRELFETYMAGEPISVEALVEHGIIPVPGSVPSAPGGPVQLAQAGPPISPRAQTPWRQAPPEQFGPPGLREQALQMGRQMHDRIGDIDPQQVAMGLLPMLLRGGIPAGLRPTPAGPTPAPAAPAGPASPYDQPGWLRQRASELPPAAPSPAAPEGPPMPLPDQTGLAPGFPKFLEDLRAQGRQPVTERRISPQERAYNRELDAGLPAQGKSKKTVEEVIKRDRNLKKLFPGSYSVAPMPWERLTRDDAGRWQPPDDEE